MSKKGRKRNRLQVPKLKTGVSNDLYMHRKGQAKRKQSLRRIKKIMKQIKVEQPEEPTEENVVVTAEEENPDLDLAEEQLVT